MLGTPFAHRFIISRRVLRAPRVLLTEIFSLRKNLMVSHRARTELRGFYQLKDFISLRTLREINTSSERANCPKGQDAKPLAWIQGEGKVAGLSSEDQHHPLAASRLAQKEATNGGAACVISNLSPVISWIGNLNAFYNHAFYLGPFTFYLNH